MKQFMKRSLALLLALIMLVGWMPQLSLPVAAAAEQSVVNYQTGDVSNTYKNVVKNWGTRGELATFLSPMAEAFYAEGFLEEMAALDGAASTEDVYESELYVYLQELMASNHKKNPSYDAIRDMFQYTDIEENGAKSSKISAFYSAKLVGPQWDGSTWTREHTWPNSKGGEGDRTHEHDILMLRPEAGNINGSRNNKAYGISEGFFDPKAQNDKVNVRGDVARIMLYTYVRWGGVTETAEDGTVSYPNKILQENMWGETGVIESLDVLLDWAEEDPVDTWEMARNDSVQSITGTRNVFVDYPELVFELFEAEIPEGYDTPSGSANDAAITVTAVVEGEGGAVSVNGEYVTVHPYAGYQVDSFTGATYTQNGDVYTVTSQEDCTITVTFKKAANYMVNVWENGKRVSYAVVEDGNGFELPAFSGTVPEGHAFNGWVKAEAADSANKPTEIYEAGQDMIITGDSDFYALMTYLDPNDMSNPGKSWKLVTSTADLVLGDSYIIAGSNTAMAMSRVKKTNNRDGVTVTKAEDKSTLSFTDDVTVAELTLTEGKDIEVTEPETTVPNEDGTVDVYKLVTDKAEILNGGEFALVVKYNGNYYAVSNASFSKKITPVNVTVTDNKIAYNSSSLITVEANGTDGISLKLGTKYLKYSGSSTDLSTATTAYQWKLADGSAANSYVVKATTGTNRALAYQGSGDCFKGYSTTNKSGYAFDIFFFEKGTALAEPETTEPEITEPETTKPVDPEPPVTSDKVKYTKVTSADQLTDGKYLIVYEAGKVALDGSLTKLDVASNTKTVAISNNTIELDKDSDTFYFTITKSNGNIQSASGYYIGSTSNSKNQLSSNKTTKYTNTITINADGSAHIVGSANPVLRYNANSGDTRFRYFKSSTYTSQKAIALYKAETAEKSVKMEQKGNVIKTIKTYAFYDPANNGYLYAAASGSNHLKTQSTLDLNGSWLITVAADGACTIVAQGANTTNKLQFNAKDELFSCYTTNQESVALYHGIAGAGTRHYATIWGERTCLHLEHKTEVVEPTLMTGGYTKVLCVACGEELYTKDEVPALGYVDSWSLTLGDNIGVNFRFTIDASIRDTAKVSITVGSNEPVVFNVADLAVEDGYMVTVPAAASQMQDEIKVQILNGEDATEVKTYTIEGYARDVLAKEEFSQYHQVLKDMLNYGAAAQVYFQHNHEGTLPNAEIEGIGNAEIPNEVVTQQIASGIVDGISFYAASLVHKERIAVRLYFKLASGNIEDYTFCTSLSDPESVKTPVCKDAEAGLYYIEFAGINPDELNNAVSIYVVKGEQSISVSYAPMDYIVRMNNKESSSKELKAMLKALYNYYLAAKKI